MSIRQIHARLRSVPRHWLALVGLALLVLAWDLWAVIVDQRLSGTDSIAPEAVRIIEMLKAGDTASLWALLWGPKGPVGPALGYLMLQVVPESPLGPRLVSVLAHVALIFQTFALARRLGGGDRAGLWSALFCAASPMVFGWCRLDFQEALMAAQLVGALQLLLVVRLGRIWPAALLGLYLALGVLNKPSFVIFMAAPGLWFVYRRVRSIRNLVSLAALVAALVGALGPWLFHLLQQGLLASYVADSTATSGVLDVLAANAPFYLALPGTPALMLTATLGSAALLARGSLDRRDLALPVSCLVVSLVVFFGFVPMWSRYILPVYPVAAVLAGLGVSRALVRLPALLSWLLEEQISARSAGVVGALLAGVLLLLFVVTNITGIASPDGINREEYCGMVSPDVRSYRGFREAADRLVGHGDRMLVVYNSFEAYSSSSGIVPTWLYRGISVSKLKLDEAKKMLARGRPVSVLRVSLESVNKDPEAAGLWPPVPRSKEHLFDHATPRKAAVWLARQSGVKVLLRATDPDGKTYSACRVSPPKKRPAATGK